ncbi:MAG: TrkH family potassium uptake protein [Opitutales bacterium]|nr:TrkH family potassium uptake protein [Opitutales bacterium]
MNYAIVFRLLAYILAAIGLAMAACGGVALLLDEARHSGAKVGFFLSAGMTVGIAGLFFLLSRTENKRFFRKEALAIVGLSWVLASAVGALPFLFLIPGLPVADALFEATSGFTTTGATVLSNLEDLPYSLLLWRALMQWIGGLGVVVFFVAVLASLGAGGKILFSRESTTQSGELDATRIQQGTLQILYLYLSLSLACAVSYWLCGMSVFDAIAHTFTSISTGGYSTRSDSIGAFDNPTLEWVVIAFMILGGTNFLVMLRVCRGQWRSLRQATEVKVYLAILLVISFLAGLDVYQSGLGETPLEALRHGAFQTVSLLTTTGYGTADYDAWMPAGQMLMLFCMIIGGCSGSTSGSTKVIRYLIALQMVAQETEKAFRSRVVRPLKVNHVLINQQTQISTIIYIFALGALTLGGIIVVGHLERDLSVNGVVSSVISTLYNIGPGFAEVGPTENFSILRSPTKVLLSILMVIGRIEIYPVLVLFFPSLWRKY